MNKIDEQRQKSKLYKLLPQLEQAIIEYQDEFAVKVDSIVPVLVQFSSSRPAEMIELNIKKTATIIP